MSKELHEGILIVFEGTDGTGKSTQLNLLHNALKQLDYPVIATREPTDGKYGTTIRNLYINRHNYSPEEEIELFISDRREHVKELIRPALNDKKIVLCDRYFLSTAAYQGAIGFDPQEILARNDFAPAPDLALLFQLPVDIGITRITAARGDSQNDFEQKENLLKVARIFAEIKRPYIRTIDASADIESVHIAVMKHVQRLLQNAALTIQEK